MKLTRLSPVLFVAIASCGTAGSSAQPGLPPETVAEFIHTVIEADRATYAEEVVYRLQDQERVIKATEHFKTERTLPLPAQMLRMGAQRAAEKGTMRYALVSPWAINKANLPKTDFEKEGLDALMADSSKPYMKYVNVGDRRYFMAIYPDRAVSNACVTCHNTNKESPKRDFKKGDTMGGVVITLPLD